VIPAAPSAESAPPGARASLAQPLAEPRHYGDALGLSHLPPRGDLRDRPAAAQSAETGSTTQIFTQGVEMSAAGMDVI